jgi:delta-aminolevulinic acid dehydratase/porphobilinogen synthase
MQGGLHPFGGYVLTDPTLDILKTAVFREGCDIIAPSGMMDGMVGARQR